MAKEYRVDFYIDTPAMVRGKEPHSDIFDTQITEAESEEEATIFIMDWLEDGCIDNGHYCDIDYDKGTVSVFNNDDELIEQYYNFRAKEVED